MVGFWINLEESSGRKMGTGASTVHDPASAKAKLRAAIAVQVCVCCSLLKDSADSKYFTVCFMYNVGYTKMENSERKQIVSIIKKVRPTHCRR